jgi:uncharacterized protein (TIGR00725 family)
MKKVTFFGAGRINKQSKEYLDTVKIGEILAENNFEVYCGGYGGLMEAISLGVNNKNGKVIGCTSKIFPSTIGNKYLSESIVSDDLFDRLRLLIMDKDIFIIQVGGIGTIAELFLTLDMVRKMKNKPIIYLFGEFWEEILTSSIFNLIQPDLLQYLKIIKGLEEFRFELTK